VRRGQRIRRVDAVVRTGRAAAAANIARISLAAAALALALLFLALLLLPLLLPGLLALAEHERRRQQAQSGREYRDSFHTGSWEGIRSDSTARAAKNQAAAPAPGPRCRSIQAAHAGRIGARSNVTAMTALTLGGGGEKGPLIQIAVTVRMNSQNAQLPMRSRAGIARAYMTAAAAISEPSTTIVAAIESHSPNPVLGPPGHSARSGTWLSQSRIQ